MNVVALISAIGIGAAGLLGLLLSFFIKKDIPYSNQETISEILLEIATGSDVNLQPENPKIHTPIDDVCQSIHKLALLGMATQALSIKTTNT